MVERGQPSTDQAHVVIKRQPGDENILPVYPGCQSHGADIGEQIGVREHHALGVAGTARGVLQQRDVPGAGRV